MWTNRPGEFSTVLPEGSSKSDCSKLLQLLRLWPGPAWTGLDRPGSASSSVFQNRAHSSHSLLDRISGTNGARWSRPAQEQTLFPSGSHLPFLHRFMVFRPSVNAGRAWLQNPLNLNRAERDQLLLPRWNDSASGRALKNP